MSKRKKINFCRKPLQWAILLLLVYLLVRPFFDKQYISDFEAYCPFGGMQAFATFLANNTLACSMTLLQIAMGIALIAGTILVSKMFCSFICPIGFFTEFLGKWGKKLKMQYTFSGIPDRLLRSLKYILFFLTFYFTMTTSELFCKKYDPYYAVFSGFSVDVMVWYALAALFVTIAGSFFIHQFWCKYVCPLGAVANTFSFTLVFIIITGLYFLYNIVFQLHWSIYLAAIAISAYTIELLKMKTGFFPLFRVTRNPDKCTQCKICDKTCPMAIPVSSLTTVNHIDCHLCTDCVTQCPEKGALLINKRKLTFLPPLVVVILIVAALIFASITEIPTVNIRWGEPDQQKKSNVFIQEGLSSIKCFGSATSFIEQMKNVKGVTGVAAFVKSHSAKIYFDPKLTSPFAIRKAIFTPVITFISEPEKSKNTVTIAEIGIYNFLDANDELLFYEKLKQQGAFYGFETEFGEPIKIRIFFDNGKITPDMIVDIIEKEEIKLKIDGQELIEKTHFKVAQGEVRIADISKSVFYQRMFTPVDDTFNNFDSFSPEQLAVVEIVLPELLIPAMQDKLLYLESHLSGNDGIVRLQTQLNYDKPLLRIHYVIAKVQAKEVYKLLSDKKITVYYKKGKTEVMDNPFDIPLHK